MFHADYLDKVTPHLHILPPDCYSRGGFVLYISFSCDGLSLIELPALEVENIGRKLSTASVKNN